jgi:sortase (surface protein transpeptidase)
MVVLAMVVLACSGGNEDPTDVAPAEVSASATAGGRLTIPSLDIDAPVSLKPLQAGVALPSPDGAHDVALYDFGRARGLGGPLGGAPGEGGNAVMAGRSISDVGCGGAEPPCNGVFIGLPRIALGARVDVTWRGNDYQYQVVAVCYVPAANFNDGLYLRTAQEQLTLLTGSGTLAPGGFSAVLVVMARRAPVTAAEPCPEGATSAFGP